MPQYVRDHEYGEIPQAEPVKFFNLEDLKGVKLRKHRPEKSSEYGSPETLGNYTVREHVDNTLKNLSRGIRRPKGFEEDLIEIRQIDMGSLTDDKRMYSPTYDQRETSVEYKVWKTSLQALPEKPPVRRGMKSSTWMDSPNGATPHTAATVRSSYMLTSD